mmetsp:Transcript_10517/g.29928  ORF Transcript_10517/g.29928 Transcript_10517/m.29928 type:complete len:356 (-) Transcript_10517:67-1134(-)
MELSLLAFGVLFALSLSQPALSSQVKAVPSTTNPVRLQDIAWAKQHFSDMGFSGFKIGNLQLSPQPNSCGNIEFVIFSILPKIPNPVKLRGMQITIESALATTPGSCATIVTDQTSQFPTMDRVSVQRVVMPEPVSLTKKCNATVAKSPCIMDVTFIKMVYFTSYLHTLQQVNRRKHVVFLDPDLIFLKDISDVFNAKFHVGITAMCGEIGLMNPGVLFCHGDHMKECHDLHQAVVDVFAESMYSHTGDQRSFGMVFNQVLQNYPRKLDQVMEGKHKIFTTSTGWDVLFVPGYIFNATPTKLMGKDARVLHYKGPIERKKMQIEHYKKYVKKGNGSLLARKYAKMPPKNMKCKNV